MAEAVAGCLDFYREALPPTRPVHRGLSLGGVVGLDGVTLSVARSRVVARPPRRGGYPVLAAHGSSVGALINWAGC
jgi:hypothetical protein